MKTKHVLFLIAGLVIGGGCFWLGRAVYTLKHGLVTLHVRNAPLADVVHVIEKQTRVKLPFDKKLQGTITLDVASMPLPAVLNLLAPQVGARWSKVLAVHDSEVALRRLESVFLGESKLETAGWTNLAPHFNKSTGLGITNFNGGGGPGEPKVFMHSSGGANSGVIPPEIKEAMKNGGGGVRPGGGGGPGSSASGGGGGMKRVGKDGTIVETHFEGPGPANPPPGSKGGTFYSSSSMRMSKDGTIIESHNEGPAGAPGVMTYRTTKTAPDGTVEVEEWSAERLVMEERLTSRLGGEIPAQASIEAAAKTAEKVHGKYVTYYVLDKSPMGMMSSGAPGMQRSIMRAGTNGVMTGNFREAIEAEQKERKLRELSGTPEEQVQRARQKNDIKQ